MQSVKKCRDEKFKEAMKKEREDIMFSSSEKIMQKFNSSNSEKYEA